MNNIKTDTLRNQLQSSSSIKEFVDRYGENLKTPSLADLLNSLIDQKNIKSHDIISQVNFSKSYFYKIINGEKTNPTRDTLLQLSIVLHCTPEDTNKLLKSCKYSPLYVKDKRDAIIYFGLMNGKSLIEINETLNAADFELLY